MIWVDGRDLKSGYTVMLGICIARGVWVLGFSRVFVLPVLWLQDIYDIYAE